MHSQGGRLKHLADLPGKHVLIWGLWPTKHYLVVAGIFKGEADVGRQHHTTFVPKDKGRLGGCMRHKDVCVEGLGIDLCVSGHQVIYLRKMADKVLLAVI